MHTLIAKNTKENGAIRNMRFVFNLAACYGEVCEKDFKEKCIHKSNKK
jgi:hypothetical protein